MFSAKKALKTNSANILTLTNLSFGGIAILAIINGQTKLSVVFIFLAMLCDRFDGACARKFGVESELGKQLDSLCDLITFGVAPAVLIYEIALKDLGTWGLFFSIFYMGCGAFRLARFNVSPAKGFYIGVPIPVAACLATFSSLFVDSLSSIFYMILMCFLGLAMVSTIKMRKV
ncbi:MAG: phosphatidylserine synthase [Bacillales bacterium]|jgi:CDP-diacylglycerol--serine O-phosphatidyltransferase|nr:phosphatidylserine synthase [Bacillales bacterium]